MTIRDSMRQMIREALALGGQFSGIRVSPSDIDEEVEVNLDRETDTEAFSDICTAYSAARPALQLANLLGCKVDVYEALDEYVGAADYLFSVGPDMSYRYACRLSASALYKRGMSDRQNKVKAALVSWARAMGKPDNHFDD